MATTPHGGDTALELIVRNAAAYAGVFPFSGAVTVAITSGATTTGGATVAATVAVGVGVAGVTGGVAWPWLPSRSRSFRPVADSTTAPSMGTMPTR